MIKLLNTMFIIFIKVYFYRFRHFPTSFQLPCSETIYTVFN